MKVRSVDPGHVFNKGDSWWYTIRINGVDRHSDQSFTSAAIAKQKMREKVSHMRKRHGLTDSTTSS